MKYPTRNNVSEPGWWVDEELQVKTVDESPAKGRAPRLVLLMGLLFGAASIATGSASLALALSESSSTAEPSLALSTFSPSPSQSHYPVATSSRDPSDYPTSVPSNENLSFTSSDPSATPTSDPSSGAPSVYPSPDPPSSAPLALSSTVPSVLPSILPFQTSPATTEAPVASTESPVASTGAPASATRTPVAAPVAVNEGPESLAPVVAVPNEICYVCGDGGVSTYTNLDSVIEVPEEFAELLPLARLRCSFILNAAETLLLVPTDRCPELQAEEEVAVACGCENFL